MVKDELSSVKIHKDKLREIKINVATYGGTIRQILERGADFAMGENIVKSKKKKAS